MTRDACRGAPLAGDVNLPDGLSCPVRPGGHNGPLDARMLGATRNGRVVFRFERAAEPEALDLPGPSQTKQGQQRAMSGTVWPSGRPLADPTIRGHLARLALDNHRTLFPKER